jgi:excisionase family DNA binding protein
VVVEVKMEEEVNIRELLTVPDIVKRTGMGDSRIRYYLRKRMLKGIRLGRQWFVKEEDLNEFLKEKGLK